jgi:hypothetical protein
VSDQGEPQDAIVAERLVFFSAAVVASVIALLALNLPIPAGVSQEAYLVPLDHNVPAYAVFAVNFALIEIHRMNHHRLIGAVKHVTAALHRAQLRLASAPPHSKSLHERRAQPAVCANARRRFKTTLVSALTEISRDHVRQR